MEYNQTGRWYWHVWTANSKEKSGYIQPLW